MIRLLIFWMLFMSAGAGLAQDLDISLFDDIPNVGHDATPLDSLRITPPPAPDIRINLDTSEPTNQPSPTTPEISTTPTLPSISISLPTVQKPSAEAEKPKKTTTKHVFHDVTAFDVCDFELGDSANIVFQKAKRLGFKVLGTQERIPLFYATDYEQKCRDAGIIPPDAVAKCVQDYACHEKTRYIAEASLQRKNEHLVLFFTSAANDNALYKIVYVNKGDNSLNFTEVNRMKKNQRQVEFWNAVFDKYGYPDDEQEFIWGDPEKAYMKAYITGAAYDAYIILEDTKLSDADYFTAKGIEDDRPPRNRFSF